MISEKIQIEIEAEAVLKKLAPLTGR